MRPSTLALALAALVAPALAEVTFTIGRTVRTADTADFFQVQQGYYELPNSLLVTMTPSNTIVNQCVFTGLVPNATLVAEGGIRNATNGFYENTIVVVSGPAAYVAGCDTDTQMTVAAQRFAETLAPAGYPPAQAIMIISFANAGLEVGGPLVESYLSHQARIPDGKPGLPTVFIGWDDARDLVLPMQQYIPATLTQQRGPWNDKFLDQGYVAYNWALFALNLLFVIYGAYRFISLVAYGNIKADVRTTVFILGIVSTALSAASLTIRIPTSAYYALIQFSTFFYNVAFYLLLLLWSGVLSRVQVDRSFGLFRSTIYFGILSAILIATVGLVRIFTLPNRRTQQAYNVVMIWAPVVEGLAAILFLVYAVRFAVRMNEYSVTRDVRRALSRLTKLSVIGFIGFIIMTVTNILNNDTTLASSVSTIFGVFIAQNIGLTLRAAGIIYILNVSLPTDHSTSGGSSSGKKGSSGWAGWSRGWRRALYGDHSRSQATYGAGSTAAGKSHGTSGNISTPMSPASPRFLESGTHQDKSTLSMS